VTMSEAKEVSTTFLALPQAFAKPAHPIAYTEATLRGEVDTVELPTEYRFEYLSEEEYESNGETFAGAKETPLGELEPAEAPTAVEAPLLGLKEATRYRFRLWAMNSAGQAEDEGAFETLQRRGPESCPNATYRFGPSANLPDCRAYELVTPADTNGGDISAPLPGSPDEGFNNLLTVPRGANAGEALSFASSTTLPGFDGSGDADGYLAERGAGSHPEAGWSTELQSPSYVQGGGSPTGANPLNGSPDQLYSFWAIRSSHGLEGGFPEGTYLRSPAGFEAVGRGSLDTDLEATPEYASPGGAHILFSSNAHLEGGAAPAGTEAIYDREAGKASAEVISVKSGGGSFGAGEGASYLGASEDGTAVVFRVGGALYLHHEGQTVEVVGQNATYAGISEAGDRVFYAAEGALWVFEAGTQTKIAEGGEATFVNVSADGSHAFFTSTAALTLAGEENENLEHAEGGKHNLYAWDDSGTHFVALLDTQDLAGFAGEPATNLGAWVDAITAHSTIGAANSPARSNPTGEVFVFQSHARLTAYDNEGIGEIYRYDPAATAGARLRCVSCDPSGASPGDEAVLRSEALPDIVLSGVDWRTVIPNLTDDGEAVFFQSPDRLLPEDANEVEDVYEWRAKGSGTPECTRSAGCLALISSGQGETASSLFSMSADGHDVFVRTREKLVGSDILGSPSIYDAREGGGIPEAIEPAPCQGDACQGQGSEPPTLSTPATKGAGEEANPRPWPCGKGRHRVRGRCVKRHVSKHHRHRHRRPHR